MFKDYRIVCVTPAGRRRYLELLIPQILSSPLVDEYQLWRNTNDPEDQAFIDAQASVDPRVRVVRPWLAPAGGNAGINQFFRNCIDPKAIYIRFDDDVVWLEPGFFERLLDFRVNNPEYFIVFPNIINNAVCSYWQLARGFYADDQAWLGLSRKVGVVLGDKFMQRRGSDEPSNAATEILPDAFNAVTWQNPKFAEDLHRAFLDVAESGQAAALHFPPVPTGLTRVAINCFSWFGREFAEFGGVVHDNFCEEEWLSCIKPALLGRTNCIYGGTLIAHFAYAPQREHLDKTDLLERYRRLGASSH